MSVDTGAFGTQCSRVLQEKPELLHNHRALKMNKNAMKFKMQT